MPLPPEEAMSATPEVSADIVQRLHAATAHGDEEHREWLLEAFTAFFAGKPVPDPRGKGRKEAEIERLVLRIATIEGENADLKQSVVAFAGPWSVEWAERFGLPKGHLHPTHYDLLAKCGARMDDFTRAALKSDRMDGEGNDHAR